MATVGPTRSSLVDKLTWYKSTARHSVWDRFAKDDQERMLADDMAAGTRVSFLLTALIATGMVLCVVTVLAVVLLR